MITNSWLLWGIIFAAAGFSIWAANSTKWGKFLGYVNVAVILGVICSNVGLVPTWSTEHGIVMDYFVPVAIVMMLFMADLRKLMRCGVKMVLCMVISILVMIVVCIAGAILFHMGGDTWKISAVAAAYFTGNLQTAAGTATSLGLDSTMMTFFNAACAIPWVLYSLGMYMVGRTPIPRFLGSYKDSKTGITLTQEENQAALDNLNRVTVPLHINETAIIFGAAVAIAALGNFLGQLTGFYPIVFYATLAILLANFTPIGKFVIHDHLATLIFTMYMFTCGTGAHYSTFSSMPWQMFAYIVFIYLSSIVIFLLVSKALHMPWEYVLLSHMACVGGPIATPPLAKSYGWSDLVLPGIIIAVLGQVVGAYCGLLVGTVVNMF